MQAQTTIKNIIEVVIIISLIAIIGVLTALIYILVSLLIPPTPAQATPVAIEATATTTEPPKSFKLQSETSPSLPAKAVPQLKAIEDIEPKINTHEARKSFMKMTVAELRNLAEESKVPNWRKLKKKELIISLTS